MGTGYAYWTDTLNVTTKATTGELKVKFLDLALYGQYRGGDQETGWSVIDGMAEAFGTTYPGFTDNYFFNGNGRSDLEFNGIAQDGKDAAYRAQINNFTDTEFGAVLTDDSSTTLKTLGDELNPGETLNGYPNTTRIADNIEIDLTNMYPGYAQVFQADIANVGTLAARLSQIRASVSSVTNLTDDAAIAAENENLSDMIGISLHLLREYAVTEGQDGIHVDVFKYLKENSAIPADAFFTIGNVDFLRLSALPQIYNNESPSVDLYNQNLYVQPDDNRMDIYFAVAMDPDAAGRFTTGSIVTGVNTSNPYSATVSGVSDALSQLKEATVSVDFFWDQYNEGFNDSAVTNNLLRNTLN